MPAFAVFEDAPASPISNTKTTAPSSPPIKSILEPQASVPLSARPSLASIASTDEKENLHPVTGERSAPAAAGKKRKTTVLAVKTIGTKKVKENGSEDKKLEPSSSSSSALKPKGLARKPLKASNSARKSSKKASRRVSPMPKVDEEVDAAEKRNQLLIDSRCYDLTVSPLANITQAYDAVSAEGQVFSDRVVFRCVKERSAEPEIRDYFSPSHSSSSSSRVSRIPSPADGIKEVANFSTPERKKIYASFTFTTPSPTSERIQASRAASVSPKAATA